MNNYSRIINIPQALKGIDDYVVIKKPDHFPNYHDYDDVDLLCGDRKDFVERLKLNLFLQNDEGFRVGVRKKEHNTHVDITPPEFRKLNLRFDVYESFPYEKFNVDSEYFFHILSRKKTETFDGVEVFLPSDLDDLVLRFFEWVEHPEKQKHFIFVKDSYRERGGFLDLIKLNTNISPTIIDKLSD